MKTTIRSLFLAFVATVILAPLAFAQSADLSVNKTGPATSLPDNDVTYTITVNNAGPDDALTVSLSDPIPAAMTFVSGSQTTGPAFSCTFPSVGANGTITCTIATLTVGSTATFSFKFHIISSTPQGTTINNTATISSATPDPNSGNNTSTATTDTPNVADMGIVKNGPATAPADTDVVFTIDVANFGPANADNVTWNDNLPAGLTFVSLVQNNGPLMTCSDPGAGNSGLVSCNIATFGAGLSASFTLTVHIAPATPPGTAFTNIATVSTNTSDPNEENNASVSVISTPPPPSADMAITKNGPPNAGPDTDVTYSITVTNGGPDDAASATWQDTLPGTLTFVSLSQNSGPAMTCSDPGAGNGGVVMCSLATFPAGATATFTLVAHVPPGTPAGTTFQNTATVSTTTADPTSENNTSTTSVTISSVDVSVNKTGPLSATAGTDFSYSITVANAGPDTAFDVEMDDVLPPGTTFVSLLQNNGPAATCGTPLPGANGTITCTFGVTFPSANSANFTLTIHVGNTPSVANTATVSTSSFDTNAGNDSSTATTSITPSADLVVTKNGQGTVNAGADITYTITLTNNGPSDASNVSLTDTLPAGTTFVSLMQTTGPALSCSTGATITCTAANFPVGTTATFTVVAHVNSALASGTVITNTATATSSTGDPNSGNESSSTNATVTTSADVSVTKSGPASVVAGTDITYTVTVTNAGPSDAQTVSLTDSVPAETTFVSATQQTGPVFSCTTPAPGASTGTITCNIASLASGATATFQFVFHVIPTAIGPISNTANVSSATTDPTPGNGNSTAGAAVSPGDADLSITKNANATQFNPGASVTFTIVVTNNGPAIANGVTVTDPLPAGMTLTSANSTQGSCTQTQTVVCTVGTLAPSASATITIIATAPSIQGQFTNTTTATEVNNDPTPGNNASTASISVFNADVPALSTTALAMLGVMLAIVALFALRK
ncbi:MAG TPA: hypothetical protein VMU84_00185 [Thermoanaerobaculia bacterium]|nr:hypothetical protein [Thermoanaerobaculia bacterium]